MTRVIYISYDGIAEPLGFSQVLLYLEHLARDARITLISFEKPNGDRDAVAARVTAAGIDWRPLAYHRRPPLLSTALDIAIGARAVRRAGTADVLHARSYVPALIALLGREQGRGRLLFDIRGFWVDERIEGGIWRRGLLYRVAKRVERALFARADAVVTLTAASVAQIRVWLGERGDVPVEVIPTCADLARFGRPARPSPAVVWSGSVGTWYRFDLAVQVALATGRPFRVVTRETALARSALSGIPSEVVERTPAEMPEELCEGDAGLCLVRSSFSKTASAPTRFAEYLAAGMPVAVTPGVGDLEALVEDNAIGVVVRDESEEGVARTAQDLVALAADPACRERCRSVARERFALESGVERYRALYRELTASASST